MKCGFCGKEESLPYYCSVCGKPFCAEHRLPETHGCLKTSPRTDHYLRDNVGSERTETSFRAAHFLSPTHKNRTSIILALLLAASLGANAVVGNQMHTSGFNSGYSVGYWKGFEIGQSEGNSSGYSQGQSSGYSKGLDTGYTAGQSAGYESGYNEGYLKGVKDGVGRGFNLRDPTYNEAMQFIQKDKTDAVPYNESNFTCTDFSATVKRNALAQGYRCFYVIIEYPAGLGHALVGFNTTDRGFTYVEPQHDWIMQPQLGKQYHLCGGKMAVPSFDLRLRI